VIRRLEGDKGVVAMLVVLVVGLSLVLAGELFTNRIRLPEDDEEEEGAAADDADDDDDDDEEEEEGGAAVASGVETKASVLLDNELLFTDCGDLGLIPFTFCEFD
jgi:hypothetical protein